jgi:hypothetical protein
MVQACETAAARALLEDAAPWPGKQHQQHQQQAASHADVAVQLLSSAAAASQRLGDCTAEGSSSKFAAAEALSQQLRVLGGALVLQFVAAARAAGGPAWQQEVPLQAVVLFGALEQLQGLALAAVGQQELQQGLQDARADATAAAEQQQKREAAARRQRGSIAISMEDSSSEEPEDDEQQQQRQRHMQMQNGQQEQGAGTKDQQQQQQQATPASGLLLMVQKLLDIIHLIRQFSQLNTEAAAAAAAAAAAQQAA